MELYNNPLKGGPMLTTIMLTGWLLWDLAPAKPWTIRFTQGETEELRFNKSCRDGMKLTGNGVNLKTALQDIKRSNVCAWLDGEAPYFILSRAPGSLAKKKSE